MKSSYKRIGDYILLVKERNSELKAKELLGININKHFMPSVANIVGTDLSNYKLVQKNQFACNRMHVGRDYRIPIAVSDSVEPFMVSPAYDVFNIIDTDILNPKYLMMWFTRKEFDRNTWFYTDADVRGGLPWNSFCEMQLPIPSIEKQREIVAEYNIVQNRINLNQQLIQKLEETAQAIYKQWFVEFEFPDENGKPYKSCGGDMVESEQLGKKIPVGWEVGCFKHDLNFKTGKLDSNEAVENGEFPFFTCSEEIYKVNSYAFDQEAILLGGNNATGKFPLKYFVGKFDAYQRTYVISSNNNRISNKQIYFQIKGLLDEMRESSVGTTTKFLTMQIFNVIPILIPNYDTFRFFELNTEKIFRLKYLYSMENQKLIELKDLLLSKLATIKS
ncbi:MAG TPA: restriction endonuclease subunit S [Treponemataceae bacterium]|nr:restriction endonuclease subunit S [Treponemataceae bacterium]